MKKVLTLLLALILVCGMVPSALAVEDMSNFVKTNSYTEGQFTDIAPGAWYAQSIRNAYELGLMTGSSPTRFNPNGSITIAETVVLACRLHATYMGNGADFSGGTPWYQPYMNYAQANGMIRAGQYSDPMQYATRGDFAQILYHGLPAQALAPINTVLDGAIPDVSTGDAYGPAVYALYRAGVLTGNDSAGTFTPGSRIERSSVAAIVSRMGDPGLRQSIKLDQIPATGMQMSESSITLAVGDSFKLSVFFTPEGAAAQPVVWRTESAGISIADGLVTGHKEGTATVIATSGDMRATCTVIVQKPTIQIILRDSLPKQLGDYSSSNELKSSCTVTGFRYEVSDYSSIEQTAYLFFTGQKDFDKRGQGQSSACNVGWKLYDDENYVVDSGTCRSAAIQAGERFKDANDYIFDLMPGTYYLELSNTN